MGLAHINGSQINSNLVRANQPLIWIKGVSAKAEKLPSSNARADDPAKFYFPRQRVRQRNFRQQRQ